MTASAARLYDRDFVRWAEIQAAELRRAAETGTSLPLDWEHLAEEVESLGSRERGEIASRIEQVLVHLLKLRHSPAESPRRGWQDTIDRERSDVVDLLADSPSLDHEVASALARRWPTARRRAVRALPDEVDEGVLPRDCPFAVEQVLDPEWWPERTRP